MWTFEDFFSLLKTLKPTYFESIFQLWLEYFENKFTAE